MPRLIISLVAVLTTVVASAQISPRMINPTESPLWIMSVTSDLQDALQTVTLKNVSSRQIVSFQLGSIMSVPALCGANEAFSPERTMQPDRVSVEPGKTVETHNYRLLMTEIRQFGFDNAARAIHTQVAVVHVQFADGEEWSIPQHGKIFDQEVMEKTAEFQCSNSKSAVLHRAATLASCQAKHLKNASFEISNPAGNPGARGFTCTDSPDVTCSVQAGGTSCTSGYLHW